MRGSRALVVGLILATTLAACGGAPEGVATVRGGNADGMHGAVINQPYVVPSTPLQDTDGAA
jgi:protein SCO1